MLRVNQIHNLPYLKEIRQNLRNNLTPAEAYLWKVLQRSKLGNRKFRRQHSIGHYVVDFYCPSENLIIELDGKIHEIEEQKQKDIERDKNLTELGFMILRFTNEEVIENIKYVKEQIIANFKKSTTP